MAGGWVGRKDPGVTGEGAWGGSDPGWQNRGCLGCGGPRGGQRTRGCETEGPPACRAVKWHPWRLQCRAPWVPTRPQSAAAPHPASVSGPRTPPMSCQAYITLGPAAPRNHRGYCFHVVICIINYQLFRCCSRLGEVGGTAREAGGGGCQELGLWLLMDSILHGPPSLHTWGGGDGLPTPSTIPGVQTGQDLACRVQTRENILCFNAGPALQTLAMYWINVLLILFIL